MINLLSCNMSCIYNRLFTRACLHISHVKAISKRINSQHTLSFFSPCIKFREITWSITYDIKHTMFVKGEENNDRVIIKMYWDLRLLCVELLLPNSGYLTDVYVAGIWNKPFLCNIVINFPFHLGFLCKIIRNMAKNGSYAIFIYYM